MTSRKITVAAVQIQCEPGQIERNIAHATTLIEQAVANGGKLVLLPELMPGGYTLTEEIWDSAEVFEGQSISWLKETAKNHGIYLGMSFLEADEEDFFNTFALANPKGEIAGKVRKSPAASVEAYFYKAGDGSHVIDTEIGRIGIGICYENLLYELINEFHEQSVDLVLQPASAGRPKPFIPKDIERFERMLKEGAQHYAKSLGVPVIMANKTGPLETELPGIFPYLKSSFPGLSMIVSSDGNLEAEMGEEEGIIVADISLDQKCKKKEKPRKYGKLWATPVPWYAFIWPLTQRMGEKAYSKNAKRKEKALSICQGHKNPNNSME